MYYAIVYSIIEYRITLYGQACQTKIQRIQILQKQLSKVISGKEYCYPTNELHDEFKLLLVKDIAQIVYHLNLMVTLKPLPAIIT